MKFKGSKKGFALIETIVVAAIIVATFAVVGVPAAETSRSLAQTEADSIARQMYVVAQDCLSGYSQSNINDVVKFGSSVKIDATFKPVADANFELNVAAIKNPTLTTSVISRIVDIFPSDKLNDEYTKNAWVVEYDPMTKRVTSVFYGATQDGSYGFYSDTYRDTLRESSSNRIEAAKQLGYNVGYYGTSQVVADAPIIYDKASRASSAIELHNEEDLTVTYKFTAPENHKDEELTVLLKFRGSLSGEKKEVEIKLGGPFFALKPGDTIPGTDGRFIFVGGDGTTEHPYEIKQLIDMEDGSIKFSDPGNFENFYAGEDIEVTAVAYITSEYDSTVSSPAYAEFNSLFGSVYKDKNGDDVAQVSNPRQLQNLNEVDDNIPIEKVIQGNDIDLKNKPFTPIDNPSIISYDGQNNKILNLNTDGGNEPGKDHNAGLFRNFGKDGEESNNEKSEIINLTLVDPNVTAHLDGNAGALIGRARDNVTVSGCAIIMGEGKQIKADGTGNKDNPMDGNAGSLIGRTGDNTVISGCQAYLTGDYKGKDPADNIHVLSVSGNAGGLIGLAGENLRIEWSSASTVVKGLNYAGGLVGRAADNANFQYSYADCYICANQIGGIAGLASNSTIYNCYAAGFTFGTVNYAYGLIGGEGIVARSTYTVFEVEDAKKRSYSTFSIATTVDFVAYLDSLNADVDYEQTEAVSAERLSNIANKVAILDGPSIFTILDGEKAYPYNFSKLELDTYPYPVIAGLTHYGDYNPDEKDLTKEGVCGVFYWEKEYGSASAGYHFYMVSSELNEKTGKYEELVMYDDLCKAHDDGGYIKEYGYGIAIRKVNYDSNGILWDETSVHLGSDSLCSQIASVFAGKLKNTYGKDYIVTCYQTADASSMDVSKDQNNKMYLINPLKEEIGHGLLTKTFQYLNQRTYTSVKIKVKDFDEPFFFSFCPYFAADQVVGDEIDYLHCNYYNCYNDIDPDHQHQIRSIEQLQFLNWNSETYNCHTKSTALTYAQFPFLNTMGLVSEYVSWDNAIYNQTHDIEGAQISNYTPIAALGTPVFNTDHLNVEKELFLELQDNLNLKSDVIVYNWFGGEFNGQTYQIKDLTIDSDAYTVGLFGTTIGARLRNVLMTSDDGQGTNARITKNTSNVFMSDYFVGGLVGLACECNMTLLTDLSYYGSEIAKNHSDGAVNNWKSNMNSAINNCAIGGYTILDKTNHATTVYGGSAVGGLVGASSVRIQNCEAVVDIIIDASSSYGVTVVGGLVGSACGGYLSPSVIKSMSALEQLTNFIVPEDVMKHSTVLNKFIGFYQLIQQDASVKNCYTGGEIEITKTAKRNMYDTGSKKFKGYYVGGVVGSNNNVGVYNVFNWRDEVNHGLWNHSIAVLDSYTYMTLPAANAKDNIYSIGRIFATSVNPWWSYAAQDGYDTVNCIINCYYFDIDGKVERTNFIEKESYLSDAVQKKLDGFVYSTYFSTTLGAGKGVAALDTSRMGLQKVDNAPVTSYNNNSTSNQFPIAGTQQNLDGNYTYPFKSVITRVKSTEKIHVGDWPSTTKVTLETGVIKNTQPITFYIVKGQSVDQIQSYLNGLANEGGLSNAHGITGMYDFGYYAANGTQIIQGDGTFNNNNGYVNNDGRWKSGLPTVTLTGKYGYRLALVNTRANTAGTTYVNAVKQADNSFKVEGYSKPARNTVSGANSTVLLGWYSNGSTATAKLSADGVFNANVVAATTDGGEITLYAGWKIVYPSGYKLVTKFTSGKDYLIVDGCLPGDKDYKILVTDETKRKSTGYINGSKRYYYSDATKDAPEIFAGRNQDNSYTVFMKTENWMTRKDWTYDASGRLYYQDCGYMTNWPNYNVYGQLKATPDTTPLTGITYNANNCTITANGIWISHPSSGKYSIAEKSSDNNIKPLYIFEYTDNLALYEYDYENY